MITGLSYGFHDAAIAVIDGVEIVEAHHSERFSRVKNDRHLWPGFKVQGKTAYYERPLLKNTRRLYAGQSWHKIPKHDHYVDHHWSHAAASYYTRPFKEEPVCVVIDAIGEWDTCSIWFNKKKVWSRKYPYSLGLFYTAITHAIGLKPMEDEYITMGMAAYGEPIYDLSYLLEDNLHKGLKYPLIGKREDIAASAQQVIEQKILEIMQIARQYSSHLCYGGGVALNCVANSKVHALFDNVWIFPSPGDSGSSLGAAAAVNGKMLNWQGPYLGYNIENQINPREVAKHLVQHSVCGVANGRAEFGPRALGNRSLLADCRLPINDTVNMIKKRQKFRPFAPAILAEFASEYFEGPMNDYMQFVAKSKGPFRSITNVDGTSRVQLVQPNCKSVLRPILEEWYQLTGCPMLLNTSLNIKGQPLVNEWEDAKLFESMNGVRVF